MKSVLTVIILISLMVFITSCESPNIIVDEPSHRYPRPSMNHIPDQTIYLNNTLGPIYFTIDDRSLRYEQLNISAVSSNMKLVDSNDIVLGGSRGNRTITITPIIGRTGETIITIFARDRVKAYSMSFKVTVLMRRDNLKYPTVLHPLPEYELRKLRAEFDSLNDTKIQAELNQYGFIGDRGLLNRGTSTITDTNIVVSKAKSAVWKFKKFTNVIDTNLLIVNQVTRSTDRFTDWFVHLKQLNKGLVIDDTEIFVLIHQEVVQIMGHTYKNVFIPVHDLITKERIIKSLLGYEFEYYCEDKYELIISLDNVISDKVSMVIFPQETDNAIELRVVWKIPIGYGLYPRWNFYVDVLTGEIVYIHQLFLC
ncbi:MAG: hypothetical protein QME52_03215 [Bacteroidota bacterium]|nr:hypothetical protein [Bacteroidota bacterium]